MADLRQAQLDKDPRQPGPGSGRDLRSAVRPGGWPEIGTLPTAILHLQRMAGNGAVTNLLAVQRDADLPEPPSGAGGDPASGDKRSRSLEQARTARQRLDEGIEQTDPYWQRLAFNLASYHAKKAAAELDATSASSGSEADGGGTPSAAPDGLAATAAPPPGPNAPS